MAKMQEDMQQRANVSANAATVENPVPPQGNPQVQIPTIIDDQHDAFFIPRADSVYDAFVPPTTEAEKKIYAIEEKLKTMEGSNAIGLDAVEMCLVTGERYRKNSKSLTLRNIREKVTRECTSDPTARKWLPIQMTKDCS